MRGALQVFILAAPLDVPSAGQMDLLLDCGPGLRDKASEVGAAHVGGDSDAARQVLPPYGHRSFIDLQMRQLGERDERAIRGPDLDVFDRA